MSCVFRNALFSFLYRAFLFPNDLQLELEYWAETGEYTSEELHEVRPKDIYIYIYIRDTSRNIKRSVYCQYG